MPHCPLAARAIMLLVAVTVASSGCAVSTPAPVASQTGVLSHEFPCGTAVTGPALPSHAHDRAQLKVTSVSRKSDSITVSYAITSPYRDQKFLLPIGPIVPTAVLMADDMIMASQVTQPQPLPSGIVDSGPGVFYPVGAKPYRNHLTISRLCPGTSWRQIQQDPARYQVAVVMSQPLPSRQASPSSSPTPSALTIATAPLPPG